ncbi:phosphotransferase [Lentzea alba]|uniref:phosphotransferase n=1 Tax=Lentzea alba TaxID=2714351 RepID=UPI0039BFB252
MLRKLHDATIPLLDQLDGWHHPAREPVEVVLHGDFAPYNTTCRDGVPVGIFDFDSAHPGPRWWDVSWALIQFVLALPDERERRTELFCDAYGYAYEDEHVLMRLDDMIRTIREHPAFVLQRAERHDEYYAGLVGWVSGTGEARS